MDRVTDTSSPSQVSEVVLYLEGHSAGAPTRSTDAPKLYQVNQSFQPRVLGVPVGTTVEFPNKDLIFHNVFSYSKTKRFDLGYYGQGKSKSVTFDKPGLVKVFCDIHANMSAYVLVVDSPFVTQAKHDGTYRIDDIPDGDYTLTVWHPERGERTHKVSVKGVVVHNLTF
jgi:plastocyanin